MIRKNIEKQEYSISIKKAENFINNNLEKDRLSKFVDEIIKIVESDYLLSKESKENIYKSRNDYATFVLISLVECIKMPNKILDKKINIWKKGRNKINLYFGDSLKLAFNAYYKNDKKIIVIPVNTGFSYVVNDDDRYSVASSTLHGQWLERIKEEGINKEIFENKIKLKVKSMPKDIDKRKGEIIELKYLNSKFYLFAITSFIDGIAMTSIDDLKNSIIKLIDYYDTNGQGLPIFIPLIGTGRSRVNFSNIESYNFIKNILIENSNKIHGTINILVYYKDAKDIENYIGEKGDEYDI